MQMVMRTSARRRDNGGDYILTLRSSADRLRKIAKSATDNKTATAISVCAEELEREAKKLEIRNMLELP
jgi:hypothetical protein